MSVSPIAAMFDRISPKYDALNHLLSFNIDKVWRRKAAKEVAKHHPADILDLATGTADLAIALAKHNPQARIIGIDISERMLEIGQEKVKQQKLENQIVLRFGDAATLPFEDGTFDVVTVAFGVRNFEDLDKGLSEISRVLKPGGQAVILEFSMPEKFPVKQLYQFYFKRVLPIIGKRVSKDESAYTYLPSSVERFPMPKVFLDILDRYGIQQGQMIPMAFGIATMYTAIKA
ncbi:MAG: bifunctional demethylmenaquinone methyltransferase/2-methoxy-6-polyprenyl-1,4-benzoquinol methylase UbiE [Bacteroidales bacterium]|nr:bifunctional demethylmenaquinone methyltransferase/2-methoxy-6-polyprenyl-1,4-benzoquinol methylase UbiE [Bacteroidales bacterium]